MRWNGFKKEGKEMLLEAVLSSRNKNYEQNQVEGVEEN